MELLEAIRSVVEHVKTWVTQNFATKKQVEDLEITGGGEVTVDETELDTMLNEEMPLAEKVLAVIHAYFETDSYDLYVSTKELPEDYTRADAELTLKHSSDSSYGEYSLATGTIEVPTGGSLYIWSDQATALIVKDLDNNTLHDSTGNDILLYQHDGIISDITFNVTIES